MANEVCASFVKDSQVGDAADLLQCNPASKTHPDEAFGLPGFEGLDWRRLNGEYRVPDDEKKVFSYVFVYGWRLLKENKAFWVCKECHRKRRPKNHVFDVTKSTSSANDHLDWIHNIGRDGELKQPPAKKRKTTDEYCRIGSDPSIGVQNEQAAAFHYSEFEARLYTWILNDNIPFHRLESRYFHELMVYLQPRCTSFLPSHQTARRRIGQIYDQQLCSLTNILASSITNINISFDLWTSKNKLALLGVLAHFIDQSGKPTTALLSLPRQSGRHTGRNLAETIGDVIVHYGLREKIGYFVTDNASNNDTCLEFLSKEFGFAMPHRRLRCVGHIFNLCGQAVLFGRDADAFEMELEDIKLEESYLQHWREKGPCGKLHNVLYYLDASPQRIERLNELQLQLIAPSRPPDKRAVYSIVKDCVTRWNSFDASIERAAYLRPAIDEFCQEEAGEFARRKDRAARGGRLSPREPSIVRDMLNSEDWDVLTRYHEILKPLQEATLLLQGEVGGQFGCIWQVLPTFEHLLRHFETLREQYPVPSKTIPNLDPAQLTSESHFSTSVNLGWQKLDEYYNKLDDSPVYVAAVVLHPRLKWSYLERRWRPEWVARAKEGFMELWGEYSKRTAADQPASGEQSLAANWFSDDEDEIDARDSDELVQYLAEPRSQVYRMKDSPIAYWLGNQKRWPCLAKLALDIYSVPAMSDAPERLFSQTGDVLSSRRRVLSSETIEWLMSLKSWIGTGLISLTSGLFSRLPNLANVTDTAKNLPTPSTPDVIETTERSGHGNEANKAF